MNMELSCHRQPGDGSNESISHHDIPQPSYGYFNLCNEESEPPVDVDPRVQSEANKYIKNYWGKTDIRKPPTIPSYLRWANSLEELINDSKGLNLFQSYLEIEGCDTRYLQLLFACRGLKTKDHEDLEKAIRIVFKKLVKNLPDISSDIKQRITEQLKSSNPIDASIFKEVETRAMELIRSTTYPNFVKSECYLNYVQQKQEMEGEESSQPQSESHSSSCPSPTDPSTPATSSLATLPEEAMISFPLTKESLNRRTWLMNTLECKRMPPEKNFTNCHARYASYLPASAVESDRQSVSSGGRSESMFSLNSLSDYKPSSKKTTVEYANKEPHQQAFIPRTQRLLDKEGCNLAEKDPKAFFHILSEKLAGIAKMQEQEEKMRASLQRCDDSSSEVDAKLSRLPPQLVYSTAAAAANLAEDSAEAIIDQHCSRVFSTPPLMTPHSDPPARYHHHEHFHHHSVAGKRPVPSRNGPASSSGYDSSSWISSQEDKRLSHKPMRVSSTDSSYHRPSNNFSSSLQYSLESRQRIEDPARLNKAFSKNMTKPNNAKMSSRGTDSNQDDQRKKPQEMTIIGYRFSGDTVPYLTKLEGKQITLSQFKSLITKKGNFKYFFKSHNDDFEDAGVAMVEVEDDNEILPLWDNKIYAVIEPMHS